MSSPQGVKEDLTGNGGSGSADAGPVYQAKEHKVLNVIPERWGAMEGLKRGRSDYKSEWERAGEG